MPKVTTLTKTYFAYREHPTLGKLLKVGTSSNPDKRCANLGAKRVGPLLDRHCEVALKDILYPFRAYPVETRGEWWRTLNPIFRASSEWYLPTPEAIERVNAYLQGRT